MAHSSARPDVLRTALIRGAFDYQGQKCSAASRAFIPRSVWQQMGDDFLSATEALRYGDVTDLCNYCGAVIDDRAFAKNVKAIERAKSAAGVTVVAGGEYDDSEGYFVRPTVLLSDDPTDESFCTEYFGPILSVHVYPDSDYERILDVVDAGSKYALTGAVIADDRGGGACRPATAPARGWQLLRQRQAHGRRGRPAAVRRLAGLGHQRQGGLTAEPAALDIGAVDQGDLRAAHRPQLSPHGGLTMCVFQQVVRPVILGAARSSRMRRAAERIPVTRKVVDRFVAGETVPEAVDSVAQLRDSGRTVTIDYLGEDTTKVEDADATVRAYLDLLDALGTARRSCRHQGAAAGGIAQAVGSRPGAAPGRREDRAGDTPTPSASEPRASGRG